MLSMKLFIRLLVLTAACVSCELLAGNDRDRGNAFESVPKDPNGPHFVDIFVRQCTWAIPCDEGIDMRKLQLLQVEVTDNRTITVSGTHPWIDVTGTVGDCGKDVDGSDLCNDSTFIAYGSGNIYGDGEEHYAWLQGELSSKGYVLGIYGLVDLSIEYNMRTSVISDFYEGELTVVEDPMGLEPIIGLPEESEAEINWLNLDDFENEIEVTLGPGSVTQTVMGGVIKPDGTLKATGQRTINGKIYSTEFDAEAVLQTGGGVGFAGQLYWWDGPVDIKPEATSYYYVPMKKNGFPEFKTKPWLRPPLKRFVRRQLQ